MALSPVEIRHISFAIRPLGYKRSAVERTLSEVADSFEKVWRDRADLADRIEQLEQDLARYRELETLLHTTLVSAERAAADMKEGARREADSIVAEAHREARRIEFAAHEQHARLVADTKRLRSMLESALAAISEGEAGSPPERDGGDEEPWEDTGSRAA